MSLKKFPHHPACMFVHVVIALLLLAAAVASAIGVYMSHFQVDGIYFGTTNGSLALIAFVACLLGFKKVLIACMAPCDVCESMGKKR